MRKLALYCFTLLFLACTNSTKKSYLTITLESDLLINSKNNAHVESIIQSNTFPFTKEFYVYSDSVLIIINENKSLYQNTLLEFRNLKDTSVIRKAIRKGNGPTEILFGSIQNYNHTFLLNDFAKQQCCWINMDSLIKDSQYQFKFYGYNQQCGGGINRLDYNKIIYENPFCFKNKDLQIDNKGPRFILGDNNGHTHDYGQYEYYTFNVTGGLSLINHKKGIICYASNNEPILEFYNFDLQKQKEILFPYQGKPQKFIFDDSREEYKEPVFKKKIPYTFMSATYNDEFIYLNYLGNDLLVAQKMQIYDIPSYIIKMDWSGNVLDCISCDTYIGAMSIGKNSLYCTATDKNGLPKLIRYELF